MSEGSPPATGDAAGFTYGISGHVMFSHYQYFDRVVAQLLGSDTRS